jgi:hypothetical protein
VGVKCVDKEMRRNKLCVSFIIFIFSALLLTSIASAQCGDCDDKNPCTMDLCDGTICQHTPQSCDDANSSALELSGKDANISTAEREGPRQNRQEPSVLKEAVDIPASCDPVNCDDGNASTTDLCDSSGCLNTPLSGKSFSVEFLIPEIKNEVAKENTTINGSQNVMEEAIAPPVNGGSIISENNSTALSSDEALMARHPQSCDDHDLCTVDTLNGTRCEHKPKNCDDGDPDTFDYCFEGVCYHTTTRCDDGNPCTIDSFNGIACVNTTRNCDDQNACTIDTCVNGKCVNTPRSCDDGKPCTYDKCDRKKGCFYPSKCNDDKTCIDGVCRYPYYTYPALYYPYYPYYEPYVAPTSALPTAKYYTIPAGTAITLPWAKSVTALNTLKVENGITYPGASPLKFVRSLGLEDQAVSGYQTGPSISERAEMIGLSWKDDGFTLTLIQPNGSILPVQGDNRNVMHIVGSNYDYYFLRSAAIGNWGIEVKPINPGANGVGFSLITGLVKGAVPLNQP